MCDRMTPEVDVKPDVHVKDESVTKTPRKQKAVNSPTKPGKRSPVKKKSVKSSSAQKEGFNPTTKAMAYDWVMKALDNMNSSPGLKKDLAEELGVKPANLINSWNNNWKKRVEKVLHDEFRGAT